MGVCEAVERTAPPTHGMTHSPEREPGRGDECLVYANYASAVEAQRARDSVQAWLDDGWPLQWGGRPQVMMKRDMQQPYPPGRFVTNTIECSIAAWAGGSCARAAACSSSSSSAESRRPHDQRTARILQRCLRHAARYRDVCQTVSH